MFNGQRFSYTERTDSLERSAIMPYLPLKLTKDDYSIDVTGLLDTGASVNVIPYDIGLQLGAVWEEQTVEVPLSGNLARDQARGIVLSGTVANFSSVFLAFAWTQARDVPVILGQMNFFQEFNVCFYRHELAFEVALRNQ
ncbi:UNVERIFIED_CONTAM: hypothetical protein BEN50_05685 [Euhalothece sp. KZN 001]